MLPPSSFGEEAAVTVFQIVDRQKLTGLPDATSRKVLAPMFASELNALFAKWREAMPQTPPKPISGVEAVYEAYPRKVGKKAAIKAIERAIDGIAKESGNDKAAAKARLLERTYAFATATAKWSPHERQFIPHPATWFNRGSYADDPKEWERGVSVSTTAKDFSRF